MTNPKRTVNHGDLHGDAHHGAANEDAHRHQGHHGAAALGHNAANGTIKSISGTTFVLTTKQGELTVTTDADTSFHSPRQVRDGGERGYQDLTFAALKVGQRVAVQGERRDDTTLFAKRASTSRNRDETWTTTRDRRDSGDAHG